MIRSPCHLSRSLLIFAICELTVKNSYRRPRVATGSRRVGLRRSGIEHDNRHGTPSPRLRVPRSHERSRHAASRSRAPVDALPLATWLESVACASPWEHLLGDLSLSL